MNDLVGKIFTAFIFFLATSAATAQTDYKPYTDIDHNLFDLEAESSFNSIVIKFKDDVKVRLCDGQLCINTEDSSVLYAKNSRVANDAETVHSFIKDRNFILDHTFLSGQKGPEQERKEDEKRAIRERKHNIRLADLNNFYSLIPIEAMTFSEVEALIDQLNNLQSVEIAYAKSGGNPDISVDVTMPDEPGYTIPSSSAQGSQGYLGNTNNGIYAINGWKWKGGTGANAKVVPVDGILNTNHEEFYGRYFYAYANWPRRKDTTDSNHGTAVSGIIFGDDDGVGVTGIVHGIPVINFISARYCYFFICGLDGPRAINALVDELSAGDIISMSLSHGSSGLPYEWPADGYAAIQAAVADGIIVVISASNYSHDLDDPAYNDLFDMSFRDSGSIIVGASYPDETDGTAGFSNYGSRVTAHSWGYNVATTASISSPWNNNYTDDFGGTSAAAPIVAGAAASIQSIAVAMGHDPLDSFEMRDLISSTGTPQTYDTAYNIGETPNIDAAAKVLQAEMLECNFGSATGAAGYWTAYGMEVKNVSGGPLSSWTVYLDFDGSVPAVTSITGGTATVVEDRIMIEGGSLGTGASAYFWAYGTYTGPSYLPFSCF